MSDTSAVLSLPYIAPAQAQKHVTHNEALRVLDVLVQLSVLSRSASAPPASPTGGDRYIVGAAPTGTWAGQASAVALFEEGIGWTFFEPQTGWVANVIDESAFVAWNGTLWQPMSGGASLQNVPFLGVQTTADATNRLAVSADATLLNHAGDGHQLKINKSDITDTASLLFQTGFGGRAEMGTAGNDNFSIKVSADGALWSDAMSIAADGSGTAFQTPVSVANDLSAERLISVSDQYSYLTMTLFNDHSSPTAAALQFGFGGVRRYACLVHAGFEQFHITGYDDVGNWRGSPLVMEFPETASMNNAIYVAKNSNVGVGRVPGSARLDIEGVARVKPLAKASLPAASAVGAGGIAYVTDAAGGAQLAFSDGTIWRKASDRLPV